MANEEFVNEELHHNYYKDNCAKKELFTYPNLLGNVSSSLHGAMFS